MSRINMLTLGSCVMVLAFVCACGPSEQERMQATVDAAVVKTQTSVALLFTPTPPPTLIPTITPDPGEMIPREFSISPPFDWVTYNLTGIGINIGTEMLRQGYQDNLAMVCAIRQDAIPGEISRGLRLVATSPAASADHCIYLMIQKTEPIKNMTLEEFAALKVSELPESLVGDPEIKQKVLNLNYVQTVEFIYDQPLDTEGTINQTFIQYFVLGPQGVYQITFVTPSEEFQKNYAEFTQMMQSFQLEE